VVTIALEKFRNVDCKQYIISVTGMWHVSDNRNVFRIFVGKSVGKKQLGRSSRR